MPDFPEAVTINEGGGFLMKRGSLAWRSQRH